MDMAQKTSTAAEDGVPRKKPTLATLPRACLAAILGYLTPLNILSVLLTSQFFHLFGEPFLYRRICIDWRSNWKSALLLFQAITLRPQLAGYVKHLTLTSSPNSGVNANVSSRAITEDFAPSCKRRRVEGNPRKASTDWLECRGLSDVARLLVQRIGLPNAHLWHAALRLGDPFVYATLFISQLHNLQTLRIDFLPSKNIEFAGLMVKHALFSAPAAIMSSFSQLRLVQYGAASTLDQAPCTDEDAEMPVMLTDPEPGHTTSWFFLPALLSLAIWTSDIPILLGMIRDRPSLAQSLARIERLSIRSYEAEEIYLAQLVALTSSVKTLHLALSSWFTDRQFMLRFSSPLSTGENLLRGLLAVRETLEDLRIQLSLFPQQAMEETDALAASLKPFTGFLVNFLALRTAEVQAAMFLGRYDEDCPVDLAQLLPPGLQSLCIRVDATGSSNSDLGWDAARILRCVRLSLPHLGTVAPNLTTIAVRRVGSLALPDKDKAEMAQTVETVEELGLGVRVVWVSGRKLGMVGMLC